MRGIFGSIGRSGGFVPPALALLLLFRLLIPSGYMIAPDREGRPGLVLCAAPAQAAAQSPSHGGHDNHPADPAPSKPGERPCPFAALAAPPLPPAPPGVLPRIPAAAMAPDLPAPAELPRVARAAPPPPATGPPLLV
jgi:hypothetical protein